MDKTSQKITKESKLVETAHKGRENYMNKLKGSILNDAKKGSGNTSNVSSETTGATTLPPLLPTPLPTLPPVILISNSLVYLLSLPWFVYFLHITLLRLQIKNKSTKYRINHQNDVICFRRIYNKMSSFDWKKNIEDSIKDGIIITDTTTGIFFALMTANVKTPKASLDATDIIKLARGICGGVLVKDYAVHKMWKNE